MSEQENKQQRLWYAWRQNQAKVSLYTVCKSNRYLLREKGILKEKWEWRIKQKRKEGFLTGLATAINHHCVSN